MRGIPFRQISWGPTMVLGLARSWSAGFVLMVLLMVVTNRDEVGFIELLLVWLFYPIMGLFIGLMSWFTSLFKGGWLARPLGVLLLCWGDPILYILSRVLGIFNYADLKLINFVAFLYVLKEEEEEEEENEIGIRKPPRRID